MVDLAAFGIEIASELEGNLLPFWREQIPDRARGGFIAEMANDGAVRENAPRGLILYSRLLWTFSALFRQLNDHSSRVSATASTVVTFGDSTPRVVFSIPRRRSTARPFVSTRSVSTPWRPESPSR
jgi:mannose/cellobiose epimerase-like protein (N-acyl-D-glucosamine 2-epimerase family)